MGREIKLTADSLYQHLLLTAERKFWRCVVSGEPPRLFGLEPPRARRSKSGAVSFDLLSMEGASHAPLQ